MARRGRPRKAVARHPSGQPVRGYDPVAVARTQRIARGATLENWRDQAHESPLGRLYRKGGLDHASNPDTGKRRYDAGVWYRGVYLAALRARGIASPHIRAPGEPTGPSREMDPATYWAITQKETSATNSIPKGCKAAIYQIVILEAADIHQFWLDELPRALDALADHIEGRA